MSAHTTVRSPDTCADSLHRNPGNTAATPALPLTTLAIESACADATACLAMSARLTLAPVVGSESTGKATTNTGGGATRSTSSPLSADDGSPKLQSSPIAYRCYVCKLIFPADHFRTFTRRIQTDRRVYLRPERAYGCLACTSAWQVDRMRERYRTDPAFRAQRKAAGKRKREKIAKRAGRIAGTAEEWRIEQRRRSAERTGITDPRERFLARRKASVIRREFAMRGTQAVPISLLAVAERDGWRCGICRKQVRRANWSLDHVVPLSRGGSHTYENVVVAHRLCNSKRGVGRLPVQPVLFAAPIPQRGGHVIRGRGRPPGSASTCSFCGEAGHNAARGGATCSPTYLAVRLVLERGYLQTEAAQELGVTPQAVGQCLANMRRAGAA